MAAIKTSVTRDAVHQLARRQNWAAREPGVMVVLCIVFVVGVALTGLFIHKKLAARRERAALKANS